MLRCLFLFGFDTCVVAIRDGHPPGLLSASSLSSPLICSRSVVRWWCGARVTPLCFMRRMRSPSSAHICICACVHIGCKEKASGRKEREEESFLGFLGFFRGFLTQAKKPEKNPKKTPKNRCCYRFLSSSQQEWGFLGFLTAGIRTSPTCLERKDARKIING